MRRDTPNYEMIIEKGVAEVMHLFSVCWAVSFIVIEFLSMELSVYASWLEGHYGYKLLLSCLLGGWLYRVALGALLAMVTRVNPERPIDGNCRAEDRTIKVNWETHESD